MERRQAAGTRRQAAGTRRQAQSWFFAGMRRSSCLPELAESCDWKVQSQWSRGSTVDAVMTQASLGTVPVAQSPEDRFDEYLQSRGKRMTQQKRQLLVRVFARHEHFDAETLIEQLLTTSKAGRVGRATVYRFLNELVEAGLLREFQLDGRTVYEHDYGYPQHDHLYCKECHRLIEFQNEELVKLRDAIGRDHNFRVISHRFIISGVCEECRFSKRRVKRKVDLV